MSENVDSHEGEVPPEVYRRRRIVALLVLVLVLLLGIALMSWLVGRGGSSEKDSAAASSSASVEAFSDFSQRPTESASPSESATPSESASAGEAEESAQASESASPAEETPSAEPTAEASAEPTETPAVIAACNAADLQVNLTADSASYGAGQNPALAVTYTNTSGNPCLVTGGAANVDVNITSGPAQVFNYAQCNANPVADAEVAAGQTQTVPLSWNRSLNVLGCGTAASAQPGYYWATATVNGVSSQPVRIIING